MDVWTPCPTGHGKFFTFAGVVERIRQDNLSGTCVPKECSACRGWHVVRRDQEEAA